jgi:hypothetical protein
MYYTIYYSTTFGMSAKIIGLLLFNDKFYKSSYVNMPYPSTMFGWFGMCLGGFIGICTDIQILHTLTLV